MFMTIHVYKEQSELAYLHRVTVRGYGMLTHKSGISAEFQPVTYFSSLTIIFVYNSCDTQCSYRDYAFQLRFGPTTSWLLMSSAHDKHVSFPFLWNTSSLLGPRCRFCALRPGQAADVTWRVQYVVRCIIMQIGGLKAAHFYAPRGDLKHFVSSSRPPGCTVIALHNSISVVLYHSLGIAGRLVGRGGSSTSPQFTSTVSQFCTKSGLNFNPCVV